MNFNACRRIGSICTLVFLILISCQSNKTYIPAGLELVNEDELIGLSQKMQFPNIREILMRDESGLVLDLDTMVLSGDIWFKFFKDEEGVIKEGVVLHELTEEQKASREKVLQALNNGPAIEPIITDCSKVKQTLEDLHTKDQNNRSSGGVEDVNVDIQNLSVLIGIIENCDVMNNPQLSFMEYETLWLVLQHAPHEYMKKYFPMLKSLAEDGKINHGKIGMMKDRILIGDGKKQLYGTQVTMNSKTNKYELLPLEAPEFVNARRASIGFGDLQEYLSNWGIVFDIPQK